MLEPFCRVKKWFFLGTNLLENTKIVLAGFSNFLPSFSCSAEHLTESLVWCFSNKSTVLVTIYKFVLRSLPYWIHIPFLYLSNEKVLNFLFNELHPSPPPHFILSWHVFSWNFQLDLSRRQLSVRSPRRYNKEIGIFIAL